MHFRAIPQKTRESFNGFSLLLVFLAYSFFLIQHRIHVIPEGDLGCFMGIAEQMHQGHWLYQDVWDNKAPGVFIIHWLAQSFTQNPNYPLVITLVFTAVLAFSAYRRFSQTPPFEFILWSMASAWILFQLMVFWEVSFVGAFTEEWGMFCVLISFLWLIHHRTTHSTWFLSGLFFGLAILIKEPFALFAPALLGSLIYQNKKFWKPLWLFCVSASLPWFLFSLLYLLTGRLPSLLNYLQGAFTYAQAQGPLLERYSARMQELIALFDRPAIFKQFWMGLILSLVMLRIVWLIYRRIRYGEIYFWGSLFTALLGSLLASALFLSLGPQFYLHYAIPCLITGGLTLMMVAGDLVHQLCSIYWKPLVPFMLLPLFIVWIQARYHQKHQVPRLPQTALQEMQMFRSKIPLNETMSVDFEDGGRFYFYLQSQASMKFPVPFPLFFYYPENNQRADVVRNRQIYKTQFRASPPNYLISKSAQVNAQVFDFMKMEPMIQQGYDLIDSVFWEGKSFYIRKLKNRKIFK